MQVKWAPTAGRDLQKIRDFVGQDNRVAARQVSKAIQHAGTSLGRFPYKGHPGEDGTREWLVPRYASYLLIYEVDEAAGVVQMLRGWHQSRNRQSNLRKNLRLRCSE